MKFSLSKSLNKTVANNGQNLVHQSNERNEMALFVSNLSLKVSAQTATFRRARGVEWILCVCSFPVYFLIVWANAFLCANLRISADCITRLKFTLWMQDASDMLVLYAKQFKSCKSSCITVQSKGIVSGYQAYNSRITCTKQFHSAF